MRAVLKLLLALLLAPLFACAANPPEVPEPDGLRLPFHVALVPIESAQVRLSATPSKAERTAMSLTLDANEISEQLARELGDHAFTRVTLLDPNADPVAMARAERADLILECNLEYEEPIWRRRTRSMFLNVFLFALGGPFGTNLRDLEYEVDAELTASIYELALIDEADVMLGDSQARVLLTEASFNGMEMSFNERRKGTTSFWKSFVSPTAFLAKESPELEAILRELARDNLVRGLASTLIDKRQTILDRGRGRFFGFDPETITWEWLEGTQVKLAGEVLLRPTGLVERMSRYRLLAGEDLYESEFGPGRPDPEGTAYAFEVLFDAADQRYVRLEIEAGSRDPVLKSYSFDLLEELPTR